MASPTTAKFDYAAIGLSVGCMIHCLALPALAALAPVVASAAEAEWVHWLVLFLAAPVAVFALRSPTTPVLARLLAAAGLAGMLLGALHLPTHDWEAIMSVGGGLLLASAHGLNLLAAHRAHRAPCQALSCADAHPPSNAH